MNRMRVHRPAGYEQATIASTDTAPRLASAYEIGGRDARVVVARRWLVGTSCVASLAALRGHDRRGRTVRSSARRVAFTPLLRSSVGLCMISQR